MIAWEQCPPGHQGYEYVYTRTAVRCRCVCGWLSTAAAVCRDARMLWQAHIRKLVNPRP